MDQPIENGNQKKNDPPEEILRGIDHPDPTQRAEAIRSLKQFALRDKRLYAKLEFIARTDPDPEVRNEANQFNAPNLTRDDLKFSPKAFSTQAPQNKKNFPSLNWKSGEFWQGFGLWFGVNIILGFCAWGRWLLPAIFPWIYESRFLGNAYLLFSPLLYCLPVVANIVLFGWAARKRDQSMWGILAGFGVSLLTSLILGAFILAACYALVSSYNK